MHFPLTLALLALTSSLSSARTIEAANKACMAKSGMLACCTSTFSLSRLEITGEGLFPSICLESTNISKSNLGF